MLPLIVGMVFAALMEGRAVIILQRRIGPFTLRLQEKSECVCSNVNRIEDGLMDA